LVGLSNTALEELAHLPPDLSATTGTARKAAEPDARSTDFWKAEPTDDNPKQPLIDLQGIRLDEEGTLLLSPARPLEADDLEAIRSVAEPLLKLLEIRRLLRPPQQRRNA